MSTSMKDADHDMSNLTFSSFEPTHTSTPRNSNAFTSLNRSTPEEMKSKRKHLIDTQNTNSSKDTSSTIDESSLSTDSPQPKRRASSNTSVNGNKDETHKQAVSDIIDLTKSDEDDLVPSSLDSIQNDSEKEIEITKESIVTKNKPKIHSVPEVICLEDNKTNIHVLKKNSESFNESKFVNNKNKLQPINIIESDEDEISDIQVIKSTRPIKPKNMFDSDDDLANGSESELSAYGSGNGIDESESTESSKSQTLDESSDNDKEASKDTDYSVYNLSDSSAPSDKENQTELKADDIEIIQHTDLPTVNQKPGTSKKITDATLDELYKAQTPPEEPSETPEWLKTELSHHQKECLTWLKWRETQRYPGGILADDMGLGKTLSMISLIVHNLQLRKQNGDEFEAIKELRKKQYDRMIQKRDPNVRLYNSHATLIIVPASVMDHWQTEIKKHVKKELKIAMFHGAKRETDASWLSKYDIVITSYMTMASELSKKRVKDTDLDSADESSEDEAPIATLNGQKNTRKKKKDTEKRYLPRQSNSVLAKIVWERIILDEAHNIKNRKTLQSRAVARLHGICRWCLSGTPVQNELWDLFSLVRFLKHEPFCVEVHWRDLIVESGQHGKKRLDSLIAGISMRRMKSDTCKLTNRPIVDLKPRNFQETVISMEGKEKEIYDIMFEASRQRVREILDDMGELTNRHRKRLGEQKFSTNPFLNGPRKIDTENKFQTMSCILVLLLRLRQACVHMALTKEAVDINAFKEVGGAENGENIDQQLLEMSMQDLSLSGRQVDKDIEQFFEPTFISAKFTKLFEQLDVLLETDDKCIIVSQWTTVLKYIERHLSERFVEFTAITGEVKIQERQSRVDSFNQVGEGPKVMLLSLTAGGVGLNLVGANHLFLLDLHWNPAMEKQACDRIYRMGQTKEVFIHKIICKDTIEQRVMAIQREKIELANAVFDGVASTKMNKLSLNDLRYLFELGPRDRQ